MNNVAHNPVARRLKSRDNQVAVALGPAHEYSYAGLIHFSTMKFVRILNTSRDTELAARCVIADNFWTRARGLLGRPSLPPGEGLLLTKCSSIHMFHMKFALDVVFLTDEDVVTDFVENIAPGKAHVAKSQAGKAVAALELPVGTIARTQTRVGDVLKREEAEG